MESNDSYKPNTKRGAILLVCTCIIGIFLSKHIANLSNTTASVSYLFKTTQTYITHIKLPVIPPKSPSQTIQPNNRYTLTWKIEPSVSSYPSPTALSLPQEAQASITPIPTVYTLNLSLKAVTVNNALTLTAFLFDENNTPVENALGTVTSNTQETYHLPPTDQQGESTITLPISNGEEFFIKESIDTYSIDGTLVASS